MSQPPDAAIAWVRKQVGRFQWELCDSACTRHKVWHIRTHKGSFYLKLHVCSQRWHQEIYAYTNFCHTYWKSFPELLGIFQSGSACGILTRALAGEPLESGSFSEGVICRVWSEAGLLASQIKDSWQGMWFGIPDRYGNPLGFSTSDPVEYFCFQLHHWENRAKYFKVLDPAGQKLAHFALDKSSCFKDERPYSINSDFTPGNWIVDRAGVFLGAIDLEDMKLGLQAEAFPHLITKYARQHALREEAFFKSYGQDFLKSHLLQIILVRILFGLSTIVLGAERKSQIHLDRGKSILEDVMEEHMNTSRCIRTIL